MVGLVIPESGRIVKGDILEPFVVCFHVLVLLLTHQHWTGTDDGEGLYKA